MPTVATGTPPGICAVESRASSPPRVEPASGTPITGSTVCAASTPARWAAAPAPAMSTRIPRASAPLTYCSTRAGDRWAEATVIS